MLAFMETAHTENHALIGILEIKYTVQFGGGIIEEMCTE